MHLLGIPSGRIAEIEIPTGLAAPPGRKGGADGASSRLRV